MRALDAVLLTHGDPDHIGGARSIVDDFAPAQVWEGIPVAYHLPLQEVLSEARASGAQVERRQAGEEMWIGGVRGPRRAWFARWGGRGWGKPGDRTRECT